MGNHHLDRLARDRAIEQSLVAALEINDVLRGSREDAPGLVELVSALLGSEDPDNLPSKRELLADSHLQAFLRARYNPLAICSQPDRNWIGY